MRGMLGAYYSHSPSGRTLLGCCPTGGPTLLEHHAQSPRLAYAGREAELKPIPALYKYMNIRARRAALLRPMLPPQGGHINRNSAVPHHAKEHAKDLGSPAVGKRGPPPQRGPSEVGTKVRARRRQNQKLVCIYGKRVALRKNSGGRLPHGRGLIYGAI